MHRTKSIAAERFSIRLLSVAMFSILFFISFATTSFAQTTDDTPQGGSSVGGYCPQLTSTFQRGATDASTGGQVTRLQEFLTDYFEINSQNIVIGTYGRLTQNYVIRFQQENNLPAYGVLGSLTRAKIATLCTVGGGTGATGGAGTTISEEKAPGGGGSSSVPKQSRYLAFQLFTDTTASKELQNSLPPLQKSVKDTVRDIVTAIGVPLSAGNNKIGFIVGPIAFDNTDDAIRSRIQDSFAVALQQNVAVGLHVDDSMFWGRLSQLNTIQNIEWLDWNKTPNTGRRLDWSDKPDKITPQLCINSPEVVAEIKKRAAVIGEEVQKGMATLKAAGKEDLFIGVIAGWETQMGRDFDTGKYVGYCALTNKGFSAKNPPADIDQARVEIIKDFIDLWTASLASAGVPDAKIYSHIAFTPQINFDAQRATNTYTQAANFALPKVAFGAHRQPGFSTYPGSFKPEDIKAELAKNGNPSWISAEGTALDPAQAAGGSKGDPMEPYLASFFNNGAVLVTIFGWGVGPVDFPFRKVAEGPNAIKAYQKFLGGQTLLETGTTISPTISCSNGLSVTSYPSCTCPSGQTQSGNSCVVPVTPPVKTCSTGQTGTYPNCIKIPTPISCANGLSSSYPNCVCPTGRIQSGSLCIETIVTQVCPTGTTGTYPNCTTIPAVPSSDLSSKVQRIQQILPMIVSQHPEQQSTIQSLMQQLGAYLQASDFTNAERVANQILSIPVTLTMAPFATIDASSLAQNANSSFTLTGSAGNVSRLVARVRNSEGEIVAIQYVNVSNGRWYLFRGAPLGPLYTVIISTGTLLGQENGEEYTVLSADAQTLATGTFRFNGGVSTRTKTFTQNAAAVLLSPVVPVVRLLVDAIGTLLYQAGMY